MNSLSVFNKMAIINFIKNIKKTYELRDSGIICGKYVLRKYSKTKKIICGGEVDTYGCYNCNNTGITCQNGCGNTIGKNNSFCSSSCNGAYYNY